MAVTDDKARAKDIGAGAKRELRTADAASVRFDETTKFNKTGPSHAFRSSSSDRNPRAVVLENKTAHPGTVPPHYGTNVTGHAGPTFSVLGRNPGNHVVTGNGDTLVPIHRKSGYDASHDGGHAPFTRTEIGGATTGRGRRRSLSREADVRGTRRSPADRHVVAWTDDDKRVMGVATGAKRELRSADPARARYTYEETSTLSTAGQSHTFRSTISDRNPRGGVVPTNIKTTHAATVPRHNDETISGPVPIHLKADDKHDVDRAATAAMAEATAKTGDQNMAASEKGNTRRSNSASRVDGRSLVPAAVAARSDVDKECANEENVADTDTESEALALNAAVPPHYSSTTVLLAHALLLGLVGLGLLGCAYILLLPVLLLLLPRVWGRLRCPPRARRPRRRTPSTSRRGLGTPHRRSKLTRITNPPFLVCALALLGRYFNLVGAAPLTDATFKQASWGTWS